MKHSVPFQLLEVWITLFIFRENQESLRHARCKLIEHFGGVDEAFDVYEEGY